MHSASHQVYAVEIDSAISLYCKELQHTSKHPPVFNIRFIDDEINCKQVAFISLSSLKSKLYVGGFLFRNWGNIEEILSGFLFKNSRILRKSEIVDMWQDLTGGDQVFENRRKTHESSGDWTKRPGGIFVYIFASNICLTVKIVFVLIPQNHTNTTKVRRKITVEAEDNSRGRYHGKDEIEMWTKIICFPVLTLIRKAFKLKFDCSDHTVNI